MHLTSRGLEFFPAPVVSALKQSPTHGTLRYTTDTAKVYGTHGETFPVETLFF
jgi:hypothetical protein